MISQDLHSNPTCLTNPHPSLSFIITYHPTSILGSACIHKAPVDPLLPPRSTTLRDLHCTAPAPWLSVHTMGSARPVAGCWRMVGLGLTWDLEMNRVFLHGSIQESMKDGWGIYDSHGSHEHHIRLPTPISSIRMHTHILQRPTNDQKANVLLNNQHTIFLCRSTSLHLSITSFGLPCSNHGACGRATRYCCTEERLLGAEVHLYRWIATWTRGCWYLVKQT